MQLGGPMVMATNGWCTITVRDRPGGDGCPSALALLGLRSLAPLCPLCAGGPSCALWSTCQSTPAARAAIAGTLAVALGSPLGRARLRALCGASSMMGASDGGSPGLGAGGGGGEGEAGGCLWGSSVWRLPLSCKAFRLDPGQLDSAERTVPKAGQVRGGSQLQRHLGAHRAQRTLSVIKRERLSPREGAP